MGIGLVASMSVLVSASPGQITPSLVPSRASGVAPLYVFFDATATTAAATSRPFHELEYRWEFGDAASGSWASTPGMPNLSRNRATGPMAAHVFESAGAYTVSVTVLDGAASATKSVQVTVTDPDKAFAANTLCVGNARPQAGSGGCPAGAAVLQSSDFNTAVNNNIARRKRILFRRGDTFAASGTASIRLDGPGLIGAFGSGAAPVVNAAVNGTIIQLSSGATPTIKDWRIMDLEIHGNSGPATDAVKAEGGIDQITLLRMSIRHVHNGMMLSTDLLQHYGRAHKLWDQWAVVDSTVRNAVGGGGYVLYFAGQRTALMGNVLSDSSAAEHILRTPYIFKGVISHNDMSKPAAGKHVVKMQSTSFGVAPTGYTEQVIFSDNKFTTGDGGALTVTLGPQDNQRDERVRQVILERNWFAPHPGQQAALVVWAQDVTVRNNLFNLTGAAGQNGMIVERRGIEPLPVNVHVYNNTFYSNSSGSFSPIRFVLGAGMMAKNNLGYAPLSTSRDMVSGTATIQSNSVLASPGFLGPTPLVPADFVPGPASPAVNAGTAVPVFSDFFRHDRPQGGAIDLGAVEAR
jgi:PKD repeat protein